MSDSLITKNAIAAGMKELTKTKSFDKITVSDIAEICGLNRQTFYYHFQDKYDLVTWIYYHEVIEIVVDGLTYENSLEKVFQMLTKMKSEDYFFMSTLKSSVKSEFEECLFKVVGELFYEVIEKIASNKALESDKALESSEIRFIADFYSFGVTGTIIAWATHGMKETPEYMANQIKILYRGTEEFATARYKEKHNVP